MTSKHTRIIVVPLRTLPQPVVVAAADRIGVALNTRADVCKRTIDAERAYDPRRRQFHSTQLLELLGALLAELRPEPSAKIIGLTGDDLFVPVLTFVFGEAQLDGPAAVVSAYRLHNEFYGRPPDNDLFADRLAKECLHELGHTYGLTHCSDYACVMHSSTSVEGIDLKQERFCETCRAQVGLPAQ